MKAGRAVFRKELRDAVGGRWLIAFSCLMAGLALLFAFVDQGSSSGLGASGFTRTAAGLINLTLLLVPLLGLLMGANAIAGERERGTLIGLLSQPITRGELLLAKYAGLLAGLCMAIAIGFGFAALIASAVNPLSDIGRYLLFVLLSAVLAASMLSLGVLISTLTSGRVMALGLAVAVWFVLVLVYDLGAIGIALAISSSGETLTAAVLLNPVEAIRILAILSIEPDLEVLGPLGAFLETRIGTAGTAAALSGAIAVWTVVPLAAAWMLFRRQDA